MTRESPPTKSKLRRKNLEKQGIFYVEQQLFTCSNSVSAKDVDTTSENVFDSIRLDLSYGPRGYSLLGGYGWQIPAAVDWLRELLLDSKLAIPAHAKDALLLEERLESPLHVCFEQEPRKPLTPAEQQHEKSSFMEMFRACRHISHQARRNQEHCVTEIEWQYFMQRHIFEPYYQKGGSTNDDSSNGHLFDSYATGSNVLWNASIATRGADGSDSTLSAPKPDIFFGYPIARPSKWRARGFERSPLVYNFTMAKLHSLLSHGVYCSPTTGLAAYPIGRPFTTENSQSVSNDHLVCFPFAVVELKHQMVGQTREQQCYCQAANAASAALKLFEKLYSLADDQESNYHVPPVVAFTCIGPKVRLWIAYALGPPSKPAHLMICVWEGDMTSFWAVREIQSILKNLILWATRVLRPSISAQISRWSSRKGRNGGSDQMFEGRFQVAVDREPLVDTVAERLYWTGLCTSDHKRSADDTEQTPSKRSRSREPEHPSEDDTDM